MTDKMQAMLKELALNYALTAEAAKLLAKAVSQPINAGHIRRLVKAEKLVAIEVASRLYITKASIKKLAASGWKPGDKPDTQRLFICYNVWLTRDAVDKEVAAIGKALGREVKVQPRKYYHKTKAK